MTDIVSVLNCHALSVTLSGSYVLLCQLFFRILHHDLINYLLLCI